MPRLRCSRACSDQCSPPPSRLQTIGGAVATGSHGSSMRYGSLSSQLVSLQVMLANGTLIEVSRTGSWRKEGRLGELCSLCH